jgi:DNA-binding LacI/PurR family transcriptional regulator
VVERPFSELDFSLVAVDNAAGAELAARHPTELTHSRLRVTSWALQQLGNREKRPQSFLAAARPGFVLAPVHIRFARESWDDGV